MICITYRSVNIGRERKPSANKNVLVCIYNKKDVRIGKYMNRIFLTLFKASVAISYD